MLSPSESYRLGCQFFFAPACLSHQLYVRTSSWWCDVGQWAVVRGAGGSFPPRLRCKARYEISANCPGSCHQRLCQTLCFGELRLRGCCLHFYCCAQLQTLIYHFVSQLLSFPASQPFRFSVTQALTASSYLNETQHTHLEPSQPPPSACLSSLQNIRKTPQEV